ncbi:MAG: hypothetical protein ACI87E_003625 [Mariniblastus sp.]|jgi:hypothetical protein
MQGVERPGKDADPDIDSPVHLGLSSFFNPAVYRFPEFLQPEKPSEFKGKSRYPWISPLIPTSRLGSRRPEFEGQAGSKAR